ncbi:hypothetical protein RJ641_011944 [Dillenia turbinata]|uniref:Retrovirus-related Pol polyprotein from transposon TNT 1-94-like beta-barrel domain-containing protein n=1 Tax=Dillenia turbinata TaxID=194707 RepID=A0AAN8Z1X3_9MAGN
MKRVRVLQIIAILQWELFTTYKEGNFGVAKMGINTVSQIVGIGDIVNETRTGYSLTMRDVRHIPDMIMNLFSINVLDKKGYESQKKNGKWKLLKGTLLVVKEKL